MDTIVDFLCHVAGYLAKQLHYQNCPHYIGFCHLAQARYVCAFVCLSVCLSSFYTQLLWMQQISNSNLTAFQLPTFFSRFDICQMFQMFFVECELVDKSVFYD